MKILLCDLLLLSLFSSVSGSCQKDCLTCQEELRPVLDNFNLEVGPRASLSSPPSCLQTQNEKWRPCPEVRDSSPGVPWSAGNGWGRSHFLRANPVIFPLFHIQINACLGCHFVPIIKITHTHFGEFGKFGEVFKFWTRDANLALNFFSLNKLLSQLHSCQSK